jgi:TRAP-type transport system periplasmic protein
VIEMSVAGAGVFATFEPAMGISALPYLFEDFEQAWAFVDSDVHAQVERRLLARGLRILAHWENGFRCVTTSGRAIAALGDLRGLKIRTPENPMILATLKALGANPGPLPWTELYMALQQRAFDGQENPIPIIYANKLYEVQRHLSLTNHVYEPMPVVIGEFFWTSLSRRQQQILQQAMAQCQRFNRALVVRQTEEMLQQLEKQGMIVSRPDLGPFQQAARAVAQQFAGDLGRELVEAAREGKRGHSTLLPERMEK